MRDADFDYIPRNPEETTLYQVVAEQLETFLRKQQLLILNRSRQRSPNLRVSDRAVAGLWAPDSSWPADPFRYGIETIYALDAPSSAEKPEISPTVLAQGTEEAGRQRTQPRSHC